MEGASTRRKKEKEVGLERLKKIMNERKMNDRSIAAIECASKPRGTFLQGFFAAARRDAEREPQ
jgi:hypothetical protein